MRTAALSIFALSAMASAETATLRVISNAAAPGDLVPVELQLATPDIVGGFEFVVDAGDWVVESVSYDGVIFQNTSWEGFDASPDAQCWVSAFCVLPQDQIFGGDLPIIHVNVRVPADAEPLSTQPITLVNEMVTDYAFTFFDVTVESGELAVTSDTICNEDVDGDGQVGFLDLIAVLTDWGSCPGCSADTDGNGSVDNGDLIRVLASWGGC